MERLSKAAQDYECDACNGIIKKGESYTYALYKKPPEMLDFMSGLYTVCHFHNYECMFPEACRNGNHEYEHSSDMFGKGMVSPDGYYCKHCYNYQEKLSVEELQEIDLKNIAEIGQSNNQI